MNSIQISTCRLAGIRRHASGSVMTRIMLLFLCLTPLAAEPSYVDLTRICRSNAEQGQDQGCSPRRWFIRQGFDEAYFQKKPTDLELRVDWREVKAFPIRVKELLQISGKVATFSFITFFDAPLELRNPLAQAAVAFGEIGEVFDIYINGQRIAGEGRADARRVVFHRTVRGQIYEFPSTLLRPNQNQLLLVIKGDPGFTLTGFNVTEGYTIGSYRDLSHRNRDLVGLILIGIYLLIGAYHLLLYAKRPQEGYNAYFGAFCTGLFAYLATRTYVIFEFPVNTDILKRVDNTLAYLLAPLFLAFLERLFFEKVSRVTQVFAAASLLLTFPVWIMDRETLHSVILRGWMLGILIFFLPLIFYRLFRAVRLRIADARRVALGIFVFMATVVFDIVDPLILNSGLTISKYGFSAFVMGLAMILSNRFLRLHRQIEELNTGLERRVQRRTRRLQQTLDGVRSLKNQQDGDYFLTANLIAPLGRNRVASEYTRVDFHISQRKQFQFRQWNSELGGDLCAADQLLLQGQSYTVFLNADAMGKSMQGAGGALVLGSVFEAILSRTKVSEHAPERWLKYTFLELQHVFESFDGSMLVSVVMGLLHETTGFLYYLNAEHPFTVLFRQNRASFLERELHFRKIGWTGIHKPLFIETYQLQLGDILVAGSDGRDDLQLTRGDRNQRVINDDDTLFLRVVEEASADLNQIRMGLSKIGELTDDLSLLRLEYSGPGVPDATLIHARRSALLALYKLQKHVDFLRGLPEYLALNPADTDLMYLGVLCAHRARLWREGIEWGERVRLRSSFHLRNLIKLVGFHWNVGNRERARKLALEAKDVSPENARVLNLLDKIDRMMAKSLARR